VAWRGVVEEFRRWLPLPPEAEAVTLLEGNTPLIPAPRLSAALGLEVLLKFEGLNPTGSFKDRGMAVAVTAARQQGARAVICASTGNTAASAAAYAARAGLACFVLVPAGAVARGKLAGATIHGARVIQVETGFDRALDLVRQVAEEGEVALVNSINPFRIEGQKTAALEVVAALGRPPDILALPVGNAGNITAWWKGFLDGGFTPRPRLLGFQAAGAAPLVLGHPVENPRTVATAIQIGNPASSQGALKAARESQGLIDCVTDEEILAAYHRLATQEGVFCEPASAAPVAGLFKLHGQGRLPRGQTAVCVLTGHGLKDPDRALQGFPEALRLPATREALAEVVRGARQG
jgi:threonine synthase